MMTIMKRIVWSACIILFLVLVGVFFFRKSENVSEEEKSPKSLNEASSSENKNTLSKSPSSSDISNSNHSTSHSNTPPKPHGEEVLEYLKNQYPGDWQVSRDPTGRAFSFSGGLAHNIGNSSEKALAFARTLAEKLGINPKQLSAQVVDENNPAILKHDFEQKIDDFVVFHSSFSVIARKKDGAVYIINNELKKVENLSLEISFDSKRGETIVEEYFKGRELGFLESDNHQPVVFADSAQAELGWRYLVKLQSPQDKREVIVGIASSKVIYEKSLIVH